MKQILKAVGPDTLNFLANSARVHGHEHLSWLLFAAQLAVRYWASLKPPTTPADQER